MVRWSGAVVVLIVGGCTEEVDALSDFTITLSPRLVEGQDFLDGGAEIKLLTRHPDGTEEIAHLGSTQRGGQVSLGKLPPMEAGTTLGILVEASGSGGDQWVPSATLAYGQVQVDRALSTGAETVELEVLLPATGDLGELSQLAEAKRRMDGTLAVVPGGAAYLFGGGEPDSQAISSESVLKLRDRDQGSTIFADVGDIPVFTAAYSEADVARRTGMTSTVIEVDGTPMILVAGGRADWGATNDNVAGWFLWNPVDDTVFDQGQLSVGRSGHLAIHMRSDRVLFFSGFTQNGIAAPDYEIFTVGTLRSQPGTDAGLLQVGWHNQFGAAQDGDAVVCGGTFFTGFSGGTNWTPTDACNRIESDGDVQPFPSMPLPLGSASMVELPDDGLLVTGGFAEVVFDPALYEFGTAPASDQAYVYDAGDDAWRAVGAMNHPRSHHRSVPLADGRVLIVGGTRIATAIYGDVADPVRCPEIFDPANDSFTELDCTDVGQGAYPAVGWYPGEGAVVLEGYYASSPRLYVGAGEFGIISTGPPLTP